MLNYLWAFMTLTGIITGILNGRTREVSEAILSSGNDAVSLCISMLGIMCIWTGIMEIAKKSGMLDSLTRLLSPLIGFLFPEIPENNPARLHISLNIAANILGLGWASTPSGLKAMQELSHLNKYSPKASNAMCNFLILNISSLQLIPVSVIAYRAQYKAVNPSDIIGPSLVATAVSTFAAIAFILLTRLFYPSAHIQCDDEHS